MIQDFYSLLIFLLKGALDRDAGLVQGFFWESVGLRGSKSAGKVPKFSIYAPTSYFTLHICGNCGKIVAFLVSVLHISP